MFGWRMEEEAKMQFTITVNWQRAVLASRKNGDYQRAIGPEYRASFSTGRYGRLTPRFLPVSI
jgi:hypothetical protein